MKAVTFEVIDGCKIVKAISDPTIDPELTKRETRKKLERSEVYKTFDRAYRVCSGFEEASPEEIAAAKVQLFKVIDEIVELQRAITQDNPVFFRIPGEVNISDAEAELLRNALLELEDRELLTLDGRVLRDERGRRAWKLEDSGRWDYLTIAKLGQELPDGYQWNEDLSPVELDAIRSQVDRDRIEAMSLEERQARADEEIEAALDSIVRRHLRAQAKGEEPVGGLRSMYLESCTRIYDRYNLQVEVTHDGRENSIERTTDGGNGRTDP